MQTSHDPTRGVTVAVCLLAAAAGLAVGSGVETVLTGLALVGLAGLVVVLPFGVLRGTTTLHAAQERAATRVVGALAVLLLASTVIQFTLGAVLPTTQAFALGGLTKTIVLPAAFLAFAAFAAFPPGPAARWNPLPVWWWVLLVTLVLSCAAAALVPRQDGTLRNLAEGTVLFLLFLACAVCGAQADRWSEQLRHRLVDLLIGAALVNAVLQTLPQPFTSLQTPATAAAYLIAWRERGRRRALYALAAAGLTVSQVVDITSASSAKPFSVASAAEIAVCTALLLCLLLPAALRKAVIVAGALAAAVVATRADELQILVGRSDFDDVTIAHRGYETAMVLDALRRDVTTLLFGLGPGGTVDLSRSPDSATLAAAGRTLAAVDDVHLLTSHVMLKFGLVGLGWLTVLLVTVAVAAWRTVTAPRPDVFAVSLLFFVVAGVAVALPAATNLLANPLIPLFLGILLQLHRTARAPRTALPDPAAAAPPPRPTAGALRP